MMKTFSTVVFLGIHFQIISMHFLPEIIIWTFNRSKSCSAPPLAILPLAVREMRAWLTQSGDNVIVLHCKGLSLLSTPDF